jgi:hypothetical protein
MTAAGNPSSARLPAPATASSECGNGPASKTGSCTPGLCPAGASG